MYVSCKQGCLCIFAMKIKTAGFLSQNGDGGVGWPVHNIHNVPPSQFMCPPNHSFWIHPPTPVTSSGENKCDIVAKMSTKSEMRTSPRSVCLIADRFGHSDGGTAAVVSGVTDTSESSAPMT